jgi:hypothetical protein
MFTANFHELFSRCPGLGLRQRHIPAVIAERIRLA